LSDVASLTISVPDDLLRRARLRAVRDGTSVHSVLRAGLARYVDDDAEAGLAEVCDAEVGDAWDQFLALALDRPRYSPEARRTWRRDDLQRTRRTDS
jgi:hypothetical protein